MIEALLLIAILSAMLILLFTVKRNSVAEKGSDLGILSQRGYEKSEKDVPATKGNRRA
jgi:hypothetical protein